MCHLTLPMADMQMTYSQYFSLSKPTDSRATLSFMNPFERKKRNLFFRPSLMLIGNNMQICVVKYSMLEGHFKIN
jgi:hypothetical protein